jgi:hypothetical protein
MVRKFVLVQDMQDILLLFMFIITEDPVKKNNAKFWSEELRIVIRHPVYYNYGAAKSPGLGLLPSSILFRQTRICMSAMVGSY